MTSLPLIDTRLLGKPKVYTGVKAEWHQWKYVFLAYVGAVDQRLLSALELAEQQDIALDFVNFGDTAQQQARTMSYILSQMLQGGPLQLVMNSGQNGLEAWRQLVRQEEPVSGASQVAALSLILSTKFSGKGASFVEEMQKFEGAVQRYEAQFNEPLPDASSTSKEQRSRHHQEPGGHDHVPECDGFEGCACAVYAGAPGDDDWPRESGRRDGDGS